MTAFGTGRWTHLHQMIHRGKHTGIMIDHNHRIAVSHQIAHHAQQSIHIRRMQSDRRFISTYSTPVVRLRTERANCTRWRSPVDSVAPARSSDK